MMRKVVFEHVTDVNINSITNSHIVGLIVDGEKNYIAEKDGGYFAAGAYETDFVDKWTAQSKYEYLKTIKLEAAFVFDTNEELFNWLYKK